MDQQDSLMALLPAVRAGDQAAKTKFLNEIYQELRKIAYKQMGPMAKWYTWQPTVLVHEWYLQFQGSESLKDVENRAHFFNAVAQAMRHLLIDHTRRRNRLKRGGGRAREYVALDTIQDGIEARGVDLDALRPALNQLQKESPQWHQAIMFHFFADQSAKEIAEYMKVPLRTAQLYLKKGKAFLKKAMEGATV